MKPEIRRKKWKVKGKRVLTEQKEIPLQVTVEVFEVRSCSIRFSIIISDHRSVSARL